MQQDSSQNKKSIKVPDLSLEIFKDQSQTITYSTANPPPFLSTTKRIVSEKDNSDPSFLRSSMYTSPSSEFTLESCSMPFSIIANPFNDNGSIQFSGGADLCSGCASYFNSFTKRDSNSFICNICDIRNESHLNYPENLTFGSFEYMAYPCVLNPNSKLLKYDGQITTIEYPAPKQLLTPIFLVLIDLSYLPLVESALDALLDILKDENFQTLYQHIGIFVLNNDVTSFGIKMGEPVRFKMPGDLPFISQKCIISTKNIAEIEKIIFDIKKIKDRAPPSTLSLINLINNVSSITSGCKIALISSSFIDINYELILLEKKNCSINLFCMALEQGKAQNLNKTLEKLSFYSSGQIFKYSKNDLIYVKNDFRNICLIRSYFNVKIALKASDNLAKSSFVGSTLHDGLATAILNQMDSNTTVLFNMGLNGPSKTIKYIQLQVTFTDFDGSRRIRVFNHSFPAGTPAQVFSSMAFDTLFASLVKLNISEDIKLEKNLVDSLSYYRSKHSSNTSSSQFVLPDSIKCLPVLIQSFNKKPDLEKTTLISATVEQTLRYFYPRLFSLSEYAISQSLENTKTIRLSINNILDDDIYILENSQCIFIYIPKGVDRTLVFKLFEEQEESLIIKQSDEEECLILNRIISEIQDHYNYEMRVIVCLSGESISEAAFLLNMVEDKLNNEMDYVDFIFKLHFNVQKG